MSNRMQNILNGLLGLTDRPELLTQSSPVPAGMIKPSNMDLARLNNSIAQPQRMVGDISQTVDGAPMPDYQTMSALRTPPLNDNGMFIDDKGAKRISFGANEPVGDSLRVSQDNIDVKTNNTQEPGLLDKLTGTISDFVYPDGEVNWGLVAGLNAMTLEPDTGIATMAAQGMKQTSQRRKNRRTAQDFYDLANKFRTSDPEKADKYEMLATALANNSIDSDDAYKSLDKSSGITINTGEQAGLEREKATIKNAGKLIEEGDKAYATVGEIDQLMAISESEQLNEIPFWLRSLLPAGVSTTIDAYNAGLVKIAKGLRVPGEGSSSDRDVELLIQGAGSLAATPEGRKIAQLGLRRAQQIKVDYGNIAQKYMAGEIDSKEYYAQLKQLKSKPLFDVTERRTINNLLEANRVPKWSDFNEQEIAQIREKNKNFNEEMFNALPLSKKLLLRPQR